MSGLSYVASDKAPKAIGPYSQAVKTGNVVYTSGSLGFNPETMKLVEGGAAAQAKQALTNLEAVLTEAGTSKDKVVKTTVFLTNLGDFADCNQVYSDFFGSHKPARSCVEVSKLPANGLYEIEAVALL